MGKIATKSTTDDIITTMKTLKTSSYCLWCIVIPTGKLIYLAIRSLLRLAPKTKQT